MSACQAAARSTIVAPAALAYALGMRGFFDGIVLVYFVACGISRLARFNVTSALLTNKTTGKVKYFEGTPIPTSVVIVAILAFLYGVGLTEKDFWLGSVSLFHRGFHWFSLLYVASGSAMISTIKVPKL